MSNPDISPLDFLLGVMRDSSVPPELRIKVAQAARPFVHAKPGGSHPSDPSASAIQIEGEQNFIIDPGLAKALRDDRERLNQFDDPLSGAKEQEKANLRARIAERMRAIGCPAHYGPREARKDENRLHSLYCKRISPPSCGGGALSEAEDAEEAQLMARVAAFKESPEGRGRERIFILTLKSFSSKSLSDAEAEELESLRKIYPDLPPDPKMTRCRRPSMLFVEETMIGAGSKGPRPAQKAKCIKDVVVAVTTRPRVLVETRRHYSVSNDTVLCR